ncbi:AraC family transcriptional regulator [Paenibacillus jamilae]|nr:AraC family transcriptional regulator [Paenibacillus jamilae]
MKTQTSPSTFNEYFNQIIDSNLMIHENSSTPAGIQHEHFYQIPEKWGDGIHRTHFLRNGLELSQSKMLFHEPVQISRRIDKPYLELALNIDYSATWSVDDFRSDREHGGHVQLVYMNDVKIHAEIAASNVMNHLELRFNPLLWQELLQELGIRLEQSFACMEALITPDMRAIAQELSSHSYEGITRQLFLESKTLELMALFLQEIRTSPPKLSMTIKPTDVQCIHEARDILLRTLVQPPSLIRLAQMVHINEQKLKNGFKELFGTTVFGFVRQQRLEKAKQLLEQEQISVSEASAIVGYSNFSHFAALFRKTYGYNPSAYRKNKNLCSL